MLGKIHKFIEEEGLLAAGDRVLVALSGGADSVCLLQVLAELAPKCRWEVRALHVHHGLRGQEADRDENFVRELCGRMEVPLFVVHRDVAGYARSHGMSTEEAGRILRYQALEAYGSRWEPAGARPVRIAVAHHQDDNAETMLHHLFRGSGLRGLGGMLPVQGNRIRPLLCVSRQEILEFLETRGQAWCEDSTNASTDYTRNRIRTELLPYVKEQINAKAVENILRSGQMCARADRYLAGQAEAVWKQEGRIAAEPGLARTPFIRASIPCHVFLAQDPVIRPYLVRHMLELAAPGMKDLTARHFRQIEALAGKRSGSRCDLPGALLAKRDYDYLVVESSPGSSPEAGISGGRFFLPASIVLPRPGAGPVEAGNLKIQAFLREKGKEIPKNQYTKWFDYAKIKDTLSIRPWREDDYLTIRGGGRKRISRFLIDEKISRDVRQGIRVLAEGAHVLWVIGYRISEYYKITDETQAVLQAEWNGGEADVREDSCPVDRG